MNNSEKPKNIIDITKMIPNLVVDLAYATENNFTAQVVPGYLENVALLSTEAMQKLKLIQTEANIFGLGLKIFDAYRPTQAVNFFYEIWRLQSENAAIKKRYYPKLTKEELFLKGYIATRSSHSRASTVDLTLINVLTGQELDMGTEFDFFGEQSHTSYIKLTPLQKKNRLLLKSLMEKYDFVNYQNEWWHYRLQNEPYSVEFDFPVKKD